ncbi:hypothetical protein IPN35_02365 [Candidatus Peregrinibacteria bacterium]|nr:MAG: hypothetical protein IPN35_02365 [Candidatus Peregrinibacteria bacterium]
MKNIPDSKNKKGFTDTLLEPMDNGVEMLHKRFPWMQALSETMGKNFLETREEINNATEGLLEVPSDFLQALKEKVEEKIRLLPEQMRDLVRNAIYITPTTILLGCGESGSLSDDMMGYEGTSGAFTKNSSPGIIDGVRNVAEKGFDEIGTAIILMVVGWVYKGMIECNRDKEGEGWRWNDDLEGALKFLGGGEAARFALEWFTNIDRPGSGTTAIMAISVGALFTFLNARKNGW